MYRRKKLHMTIQEVLMKKVVIVLLALCMVIPVLANGQKESADKPIVLKMASPSNREDNNVKAFYYFEEQVEAATNGRIDVQVFDSGQLGDHKDYIGALQIGSLQGAEINTSVLNSIDASFMVFDLPYIVNGMDHEREVILSGVGDTLSKTLEAKADIVIGGWMIRSLGLCTVPEVRFTMQKTLRA